MTTYPEMPKPGHYKMDYLDRDGKQVIGMIRLQKSEYHIWKKDPKSDTREVLAFCTVYGMEDMAEWGLIPCYRIRKQIHTQEQS